MNRVILFLLLSMVAGCSTAPPSRDFVSQLDYGPKPSQEEMQQIATNYISARLKDPTSAQYKFRPNIAKVYSYNQFDSDNLNLAAWGWFIGGEYNAKNGFGGYTGFDPFYLLYRNGAIVEASLERAEPSTYVESEKQESPASSKEALADSALDIQCSIVLIAIEQFAIAAGEDVVHDVKGKATSLSLIAVEATKNQGVTEKQAQEMVLKLTNSSMERLMGEYKAIKDLDQLVARMNSDVKACEPSFRKIAN
jgi:hypothetical protein